MLGYAWLFSFCRANRIPATAVCTVSDDVYFAEIRLCGESTLAHLESQTKQYVTGKPTRAPADFGLAWGVETAGQTGEVSCKDLTLSKVPDGRVWSLQWSL